MPLHIIVDGYNVIRQSKDLARLDRSSLEEGRQGLIDLLAAYKRLKGHAITVVFDGSDDCVLFDHRDREKGIRIRYSCKGETADTMIKRMAAQEKQKALVVSSDREVADFAAAQGAATINSLEFEDRMALAAFMDLKGEAPESRESGSRPLSTKKKGPSRRLTKKQRLYQKKLNQL